MDDIVKRMREAVEQGSNFICYEELLLEAAIEIEKLRKELNYGYKSTPRLSQR